jgi:hypothetical protein
MTSPPILPTDAPPAYSRPLHRPPLGLPPGSVRAVITLLIVGLFWALLLFSDRTEPIPLYLYFLLSLVLVFFVAHGHTIGSPAAGHANPLWLPRGFVRVLIVLGFLASVGWRLYQNPELLQERLTPSPEQLRQWPYLLLALGGGFTVGRLLRLGPWRQTPAFQDILAWVSLVAMVALVAEILLVTFILPGTARRPDLSLWECILTGVVACYFGSRS